jgi:hypothetical protein
VFLKENMRLFSFINSQFYKQKRKTSYSKVEDENKRVYVKPWKNTLGLFREAILKLGGF